MRPSMSETGPGNAIARSVSNDSLGCEIVSINRGVKPFMVARPTFVTGRRTANCKDSQDAAPPFSAFAFAFAFASSGLRSLRGLRTIMISFVLMKDWTACGDPKISMCYYYLQIEGTPQGQVWKITDGAAERVGVTNPKGGANIYFERKADLSIWETLAQSA
jgi:hypothetical protein